MFVHSFPEQGVNIIPLRVAAYCRVSTDREDQANSLQSQQTYFSQYIRSHPGWSLTEIFADEGITGTSTCRRQAFNRMVNAAEAGRLDLILTKEVSRFARNTVDTLEYTRRFKALGIGVVFINDNIDTRDNDGELRLTIMASMAQEESRKTSERVKWGQTRRMEAGVVFGNNSTYGFETRGGQLFVKPEEADVIRLIYHKFLDEGKGTHVIARELYEAGIPPPKTATGKWSCVMILRILRNEKYVGDLLQKKFVTTDFLTHRKVKNKGQEEQILFRDHHEAIVDRATWDAVQAELARRSAKQGGQSKYSNRYWCSGKIRCGACGSRFVLRKTTRANGDEYRSWGCHSRVHYGRWKRNGQGNCVGCNMRMINEKTLTACISFVLKQLDLDADAIIADLLSDLKKLCNSTADNSTLERLQAKQAAVVRKKANALDAFLGGTITAKELAMMRERYDRELTALDEQMVDAVEAVRAIEAQKTGLEDIIETALAGLDRSEEVWREVIESVTVFEEYIDVKVQYVSGAFRICYTTGGKQSAYTTTIEHWEMVCDNSQKGGG